MYAHSNITPRPTPADRQMDWCQPLLEQCDVLLRCDLTAPLNGRAIAFRSVSIPRGREPLHPTFDAVAGNAALRCAEDAPVVATVRTKTRQLVSVFFVASLRLTFP